MLQNQVMWLNQQNSPKLFVELPCAKISHLFCFDSSYLSDEKICCAKVLCKIIVTPEVRVKEVKYV